MPRPAPTFQVENLTRRCLLATSVRAARTSRERRRGLLDVVELSPGAGLWLEPCEAIHTFGMKVQLDAIFLDREGRVKKVYPGLKPNRVAFCWTATSVLEVKAGIGNATGTVCGDRLVFHRAPTSTAPADADR